MKNARSQILFYLLVGALLVSPTSADQPTVLNATSPRVAQTQTGLDPGECPPGKDPDYTSGWDIGRRMIEKWERGWHLEGQIDMNLKRTDMMIQSLDSLLENPQNDPAARSAEGQRDAFRVYKKLQIERQRG